MHGYLSTVTICSEMRTVFREQNSGKTVSFVVITLSSQQNIRISLVKISSLLNNLICIKKLLHEFKKASCIRYGATYFMSPVRLGLSI